MAEIVLHEQNALLVDGPLPGGAGIILGGKELAKMGLMATIPALPALDVYPRFEAAVNETPDNMFKATISSASIPAPRFIRISDPRQFLIYTDGSCLDNGRDGATAGCAFVFRPELPKGMIPRSNQQGVSMASMQLHTFGYQSWRLELRGPTGALAAQTSNRAELRAVIGAIQFRYWIGEGFHRLVIATDSTYVVDGATNWVKTWQKSGWKTTRGKKVVNQDLWKELIKELDKWRTLGLEITFWHIPRELNSVADRLAKTAATRPAEPEWSVLQGIAC
jgi:ribonuclease HI